MSRFFNLLFAVASVSIACHSQQGQQTHPEPSLQETFDWMTNTLKPAEGNVSVIHRPYQRPYPKDWVEERIDPYHSEVIAKFFHDGCRVEFDVEVTDNDMGLLLGKHFVMHDVDTFDLKDIDPKSVHVLDSCAPLDTPQGSTTPYNCEDTQGKFVIVQPSNAKATIHEESSGASWKSEYRPKDGGKVTDELCNAQPDNGAYCDQPERKNKPSDLTSIQLGFSTPEYAKRFAKAFRNAVELCGGKPSAF